jgi:transposase InsO family protein
VINASAHLILRVRKSDSIRSHLRSLNWLFVNDRITFRIATLTYRWLNGSAPSYLARLIIPLENSLSLRSFSSALLRVPRTRHVTLGDWSFAKITPSIWNRLPLAVRNAPHSPSFVVFYSSTFSTDVYYAFSVTLTLKVLFASLELYLDNARYK